MEQHRFELSQLLPDLGAISNGGYATSEGLSAIVVLILILMMLYFIGKCFINYVQAKKHLRFYQDLIQGMTAEQLLEKRRDISNRALKHENFGKLWKEFDESLVHIPNKQRLGNTLDAEHFFNTHTLARGLTENRLLAAVPGFLTAIGVLGTFAGLQLGLSELADSMTAEANVEDYKIGIFAMIGGASIAFMTSVWGVGTSLLFNFIEKVMERRIRAAIASFQNQVDYLYPRITAEQSLSNIEETSRVSSEKLAELDEKIGHRMQTAMQQASVAIRDGLEQSLTTILAPAIERLVDNAHSGSSRALESLIEKFMEGVGSAGNAQQEMMHNASAEMRKSADSMAEGMHEFLGKLNTQFDQMVVTNQSTVSSMQQALSEQMEAQQGREVARQKIIHDQLKTTLDSQTSLSEMIETVVRVQQTQNESLVSEIQQLFYGFNKLADSHISATENMGRVASDLKASSNQLGLLATSLKESTTQLGQDISTAARQVHQLSELNEQLVQSVMSLSSKLESTSDKVLTASTRFETAAEKADHGLVSVNQHFDRLGNSMREHVSQLESQVARLLKDYAEQVNAQTKDRMSVWVEQTNQYLSTMTDAVQALNGVVEEIENKLGADGRR